MEIKTEIENIKECLAGYVGGVYAQAYAAIELLENELETLRAENGYCKRLALDVASQKAVGEVTEDNGALGAVFYKNSELQCGETIYAKPVSALALEDKIQRLEAENAKLIEERDDVLGRKRADELAENGDMYADVYCQIVDMIEPYVKRGFNDSGELPASVVNSFEIIFKFWIEHKAERESALIWIPARS